MLNKRIALLKACERYLETKPAHRYGFCWWARWEYGVPGAYGLIARIQDERFDHRVYVADEDGPAPARIQFVQDLRDHLLLDI